MKKDEIISLIRASYDKLILIVVLAVILVSLLILILSAGREKKSLADNQWEPALIRPAQPSDKLAAAVCDAIEAVGAPFQLSRTTRMVVAELRVNCIKCGRPIPVNAETCPFSNCRAQQPRIASSKTKDIDFDGLPDEWEKRYELNPNIDDANQDADGDGFTNLEEFFADTDPKDSANTPPPVSKLRVLKAGRIPLPLTFGGAQRLTKDDTLFLVKNKRTRRDHYVHIGDTVDGYKITGYEQITTNVNKGTFKVEEDVSVLKISKGGKSFALTVGDKGGTQGELAASLIYLIDNAKMLVKKGEIISLKNNRYKVVDIDGQNVTVADMQSGAEIPLEPFEGASK
ncbi:MAG: hypothetical protein Q7J98_14060 [Kiritimatiellia bacterium]|nr:hypothetical protein [Kiritimatiellia bacterium]